MENLLSNAVKFNKTKGEIKIVSKKEGNNLVVSVTDSGYGIPKKEYGRVFTKFFK